MLTEQDVIQIGKSYLSAFAKGDFDVARKYVTDDFHFKGAIDEFHSADKAFETFSNIAPMIEGIDIISATSGNGEACFIYLFRCKQPIGVVPTADFMKFSDGKICSSRIFYDPRSFSPVMEIPAVKTEI